MRSVWPAALALCACWVPSQDLAACLDSGHCLPATGSGGGGAGGSAGGGGGAALGDPLRCRPGGRWSWSCVQAELSASQDAGSPLAPPVLSFWAAPDAGAGQQRWAGAVFAPTGEVVCVPFEARSFLFIQPDGGLRLSADTGVSHAFVGAAVANDGKIYAVPSDSSRWLLALDPVDGGISQREVPNLGSRTQLWGAVADLEGRLWLIPLQGGEIFVVDPLRNETRSFHVDAGTSTFRAGGLFPNGHVLAMPQGTTPQTHLLEIEPLTDGGAALSLHPVLASGGQWISSVIATDGRLFGVPQGFTSSVALIEGTSSLTQQPMPLSGGYHFNGAAHAPDGRLVFVPEGPEPVKAYFPEGSELTTAAGGGAAVQWHGAATGLDGRVYACPRRSPDVLVIDTRSARALPSTALLSPWLNHL